jgi:hypothetical protein
MGLVRGMARTAVVAGTATAVSNRVSRRQANRWGAQEAQQQYQEPPPQQYAPPPQQYAPAPAPAGPPPDRVAQLKTLADLKAQGILTDGEFENEKAKILAS